MTTQRAKWQKIGKKIAHEEDVSRFPFPPSNQNNGRQWNKTTRQWERKP